MSNFVPDNCDYIISWGNYIPASTILLNGSMNGWSLITAKPFSDGSVNLDLPARKTYDFKIVDGGAGGSGTWYGLTDANCIVSTMGLWECSSSGSNIPINTADEGTYTFAYNNSNQLSVTYPSTSHPNINYVYLRAYGNWANPHAHFEGSSSSGVAGTKNGGQQLNGLTSPSTITNTETFNISTEDQTYFYTAVGEYPQVNLHNNDGGSNESGNKDVEFGRRLYHTGSAWTWGGIPVFIGLNRKGATNGDQEKWVDFNSTELDDKEKITPPTKDHYDFGGYWTEDTNGDSGDQVIDEDGKWIASVPGYTDEDKKWIHPGTSTTLYAKWTIHPYTITLQVSPTGAGTISPTGTTTGYNSVNSANITATPNAGWKFKEWQFEHEEEDYKVWAADTYNSFSNPVQVKVKANATLTAVFEPRYVLVGSAAEDGNPEKGMPGWSVYTAEFTVNSSSPVNLSITRSLEANTKYKFQVHDRVDGNNYGDGKDGLYQLIEKNRAHCENENMDMKFQTTGAAKYVFQIDEIDGSGRPYVKLLWPRQVNFGWKYVNADEPNTMKDDGGGGTVTVYAHEAGEKRAIASSGGYIMQGGTISFTAHPYVDYDFAGWWGSYSYDGDRLFDTDSISWPVTSENANAFAKFTEKTNTLTTGTTWNTDGNWSKGHVPTQDEVAVIQSPVEVNSSAAKAKKVLLMQDGGHNGKVEIPAGKELVVRTTIKKTTDGSTYGATGYEDIVIGSSLAEGNGALVMNTNNGTNKATVYFATKAKKVGGLNVNQFIGTPFNDENDILYDYYGTKIYRFMAGHDGDLGPAHEWKRVASTGEKMNGFFGYNILTNQTTEPVMEMQGTLNRSAEENITGYYNGISNTENMFANSWVAPIYIPNFEDDDFTNIEKTIYIFNAGTPAQQDAAGAGSATATSPGQYIVLPINASPWTGMKVIPSMQAFSVYATNSSPSLKFDYERLVYSPALETGEGHATIVPTRAPRRTEAEQTAPTVLKLKASGESGYAANIVLLNRADFSEGFDDGWDGRFLPGDDAAPQLYAVTTDGNMAINCSPDIEGTLLGFKAGEADNVFTFTFEYDDEALYLYDTQTQLYTRVQTGNSYTFTTTDEDAHNRFILTRNAPSIATGMDATPETSPGANKVIIDTHLYIFRAGMLYDATGRIIK